HGPPLRLGGQWNRATHVGARLLRRPHNVRRRLIDHRVIERLETNPDSASHSECLLLRECYARIFVTTPAPTVRPPSRIAKRSCSSIAIGVISSIVIFVLSPGITISTPPPTSPPPPPSLIRPPTPARHPPHNTPRPPPPPPPPPSTTPPHSP